jgi:hypothetical protein
VTAKISDSSKKNALAATKTIKDVAATFARLLPIKTMPSASSILLSIYKLFFALLFPFSDNARILMLFEEIIDVSIPENKKESIINTPINISYM